MVNTYLETEGCIDADAVAVWSLIRDFNGLPGWHPLVTDSEILGGKTGDTVGAVRKFTQQGGIVVTEQLLALDDHAHCIKYLLLDAPLPVENYISTIKVDQILDVPRCTFKWNVKYSCAAADVDKLNSELSVVFMQGIESVNERLGQPS